MDDVVRTCRRTWKELGVRRAARDEMAAELEADLAEAAAAGLDPEAYLGCDPRAVAAAWAQERGLVRPRLRLAVTSAAALVGAVPGAAFGLFGAYGLSSDAMAEMFGTPLPPQPPDVVYSSSYLFDPPMWLILGMYVLGALFAYAGAVAAVRAVLAWRRDPAAGETARAFGAGFPLVVLAAIAATIVFSWSLGHSTRAAIVLADVAVAASVLATGAALLRAVTVRGARRNRPPGTPLGRAVMER